MLRTPTQEAKLLAWILLEKSLSKEAETYADRMTKERGAAFMKAYSKIIQKMFEESIPAQHRSYVKV